MHLNTAIRQLNPSVFSIVGGGENNRITTPICYDKDGNEVAVDLTEAQALVASKAYIDNRLAAYPSIQEQLDMQYWDSVNGTTTWADAIAQVKADYPKETE